MKIQQLQQNLEIAQQQEIQYKAQMEVSVKWAPNQDSLSCGRKMCFLRQVSLHIDWGLVNKTVQFFFLYFPLLSVIFCNHYLYFLHWRPTLSPYLRCLPSLWICLVCWAVLPPISGFCFCNFWSPVKQLYYCLINRDLSSYYGAFSRFQHDFLLLCPFWDLRCVCR